MPCMLLERSMRIPSMAPVLAALFTGSTRLSFAAGFTDADWVSLGGLPGANSNVMAIAVNTNSGLIYIGGQFKAVGLHVITNVAVWNGTDWLPLGPGLNGTVSALALDPSGNLYAGGQFTSSGPVAVTNVAK